MLQRLIAAVLGVLGLLSIGLGVASSTVWRGDDILVATASPDAHLVVADPGVLELAGNPVTVTVHAADDTPVVIAVGRDTDVAGWVGTDAHAQVTGLSSWHALRTEKVAAQAPTPATTAGTETAATDPAATEPATTDASAPATTDAAAGAPTAAVDPSGSDLWVAQATGNGTATLTWSAQPGRWSLLVASVGDAAPVIELAWPRTVTTPWLWPGVVGGSLLLLAGLVLGARLWLRARRGLTEPEWHPVLTGAMPTVTVTNPAAGALSVDATETVVLTRRQMREAEAANGASARRRGRGADAPATGAQPLVIPGAGRESSHAAPAQVEGIRAPAASGPAPAGADGPVRAAGPVPAGAWPAARRDAGHGADVPPAGREPNTVAGPTWTPAVDTSRTSPRQPSVAPPPVAPPPVHTAPGLSPAEPTRARPGQPSSAAALPSYFQRASAPGSPGPAADTRYAPDAPVAPVAPVAPGAPGAPGGWVPGGAHRGSPSQHRAAGPAVAGPPSARDAARPDAARPDLARSGAEMAARPGQTPAPRPTWAAGKPVVPDEPTDEPSGELPGARADAWRRAWGFPGHDAGGADDAAGTTDEGTHR